MSAPRKLVVGIVAGGAAAVLAAVPAARAAAAAATASGETVYAQNCSACHQASGLGVTGAFPMLAGDAIALGPTDRLTGLILRGRGGMPSFRNDLSDDQIAAVLTYVRAAWGNHAAPVSELAVRASRGAGSPAPASQAIQAH